MTLIDVYVTRKNRRIGTAYTVAENEFETFKAWAIKDYNTTTDGLDFTLRPEMNTENIELVEKEGTYKRAFINGGLRTICYKKIIK